MTQWRWPRPLEFGGNWGRIVPNLVQIWLKLSTSEKTYCMSFSDECNRHTQRTHGHTDNDFIICFLPCTQIAHESGDRPNTYSISAEFWHFLLYYFTKPENSVMLDYSSISVSRWWENCLFWPDDLHHECMQRNDARIGLWSTRTQHFLLV